MCLRFWAKQTRIACGMKERCLVVHNIFPSSSHLCLQGLLLIDVLDNQILRRRGSKEDQERCLMKTFQMTNHHWFNRCLQVAVEEGFYMASNQERGGINDILLLFRKCLISVFFQFVFVFRCPFHLYCIQLQFWRFFSRKHFEPQQDLFYFLATLLLLALGHYIGGYSEILTGCSLRHHVHSSI